MAYLSQYETSELHRKHFFLRLIGMRYQWQVEYNQARISHIPVLLNRWHFFPFHIQCQQHSDEVVLSDNQRDIQQKQLHCDLVQQKPLMGELLALYALAPKFLFVFSWGKYNDFAMICQEVWP